SALRSATGPGMPGIRDPAKAIAKTIGHKKSEAGSSNSAAKLSAETRRGGTAKTRKRRGSKRAPLCPRGSSANQIPARSTPASQVAKMATAPPRAPTRPGACCNSTALPHTATATPQLTARPSRTERMERTSRPHSRRREWGRLVLSILSVLLGLAVSCGVAVAVWGKAVELQHAPGRVGARGGAVAIFATWLAGVLRAGIWFA